MALGRCLLLLGLGPGSQWMNRLAASRILGAGRGRNHFRRQVFAEEYSRAVRLRLKIR